MVVPGTATDVCGSRRAAFAGRSFQAGGPGPSPVGGNFVSIDGDPAVTDSIYQTLDGLVVGQSYDVSFWQAAAQFLDGSGDTTERWDVSLGGTINLITGNFDNGVHLLSSLMVNLNDPNNPNDGFHAWEKQTLRFKVTGGNPGDVTSQVLGFFALGTPGLEPPIVLLDGVSITAVPEPETYALLGIGLLGIVAVLRQQGA